MEENVVQTPKKNSLFLAILCAIGMGFVGSLLWGVMYYLGYIAWIASFLTAFLAMWGFKKIYKKSDWKAYVAVSIISVIEIFVVMLFALDFAIMSEFAKHNVSVSFGDVFNIMFEFIGSSPEIKNALIVDCVLSLLFIAVGLVLCFVVEKQQAKKQKEANRNAEIDNLQNVEDVVDITEVASTENEEIQHEKIENQETNISAIEEKITKTRKKKNNVKSDK